MPESWMLARLQRETELYHGDADTSRLAMIGAPIDAERYLDFLIRIYGFESPVEASFAMTAGLDEVLDLRARGQIKLLRSDLQALGVLDPTQLPRCRTSLFDDPADALGWAYVLERNALLHGVVERHLRQQMPDVLRSAGNYLAAQERSAGARWRELGLAMDRVATRTPIADRIGNAAKAAFRAQRSWYGIESPPRLRVA